MKDIVVFKKNQEEYQYTLLITFDKEEDLDIWLDTTLENKDDLIITKQLKNRHSRQQFKNSDKNLKRVKYLMNKF
ncbi:hypothetical protein FDF26_15320 [Clostridium botulinum]|nr:hypothetical protein [Clostridium botulinum]